MLLEPTANSQKEAAKKRHPIEPFLDTSNSKLKINCTRDRHAAASMPEQQQRYCPMPFGAEKSSRSGKK
jgi:hypothetical protein